MGWEKIEVTEEYAGMRLDKFLANNFQRWLKQQIKYLITSEQVLVNSKVEFHPQYQVRLGDILSVNFTSLETTPADDGRSRITPISKDLDILFEDENLLALNKPAGLETQQQKDRDSLAARVKAYLIENNQDVWGPSKVGIVHRLDKATSGVIVFAKNQKTLSELARAFAERRVVKEYLALVPGAFTIDTSVNRPVGGKLAKTDFQLLKYFAADNYSLILARPLTGRKHQIRIHLQALGYPILGDRLYGGKDYNRLMLHSSRLAFTLAEKAEEIYEFKSNLPGEFQYLGDVS